MQKIILASQSLRRQELLKQVGIEFVCMPAKGEEHTIETIPREAVIDLARQKSAQINAQIQNQWILAADTVVAFDRQILGKPRDERHAKEMLTLLQGKTHQVYTGVSIINQLNKEEIWFAEQTKVEIYPMSEQEILDYIATREPMDKAGAYAIQGKFAAYIKRIEGDFYNVVGLPVARVFHALRSW